MRRNKWSRSSECAENGGKIVSPWNHARVYCVIAQYVAPKPPASNCRSFCSRLAGTSAAAHKQGVGTNKSAHSSHEAQAKRFNKVRSGKRESSVLLQLREAKAALKVVIERFGVFGTR
jgi:hypothetical protein